jgi:phage tail-like protein
MPEFTVNPQRVDPYKGFKFRVKWDGKYVAGVSRVSGLRRFSEVVLHREGGGPSTDHKAPGRTEFDPITLERGVTHDPAFEDWVSKVWAFGATQGHEVALKDFRKEVRIELYNEAGQEVKAWNVFRCWPSAYQALSDLDADSDAVAIESLTLQNEGWIRDETVVEPAEHS